MSQAEVSKSYKDLKVWQKGIDFVTMIYSLVLDSPLKRHTASKARYGERRFLSPLTLLKDKDKDEARGPLNSPASLAEVDTQLELARKLEYVTETEIQTIDPFTIELRKMLYGLINSLSTR